MVQTEVLPAVTAEEVQSLATWLNEVETAQIYEHLQNDSLLFSEAAGGRVDAEPVVASETESSGSAVAELASDPGPVGTFEIEAVDHPEITEAADNYDRPAEFESSVVVSDDGLIVGSVELQRPHPKTQSQAIETHVESLDIPMEVESVISEIEDSFASPEQEILGALVIGILTADVFDAYPNDMVIGQSPENAEAAGRLSGQSETILLSTDKFTAYLEKFEPEVRAQAAELVNSISEVVNKIKSEDDILEQEKTQLIAELEQTIHELYAILGIELADEQAHKYVALLLLALDNKTPASKNHDYAIEYLNKMGTREYKPFAGSFVPDGQIQSADRQSKHVALIGNYTTQMCLA